MERCAIRLYVGWGASNIAATLGRRFVFAGMHEGNDQLFIQSPGIESQSRLLAQHPPSIAAMSRVSWGGCFG